MKKIWAGLIAGVLILVLGFLLNFVFGWIFPDFQAIYTDTNIFLPMDGGRGLLFFVYPFALGLGLAWLYGMLKKSLPKDSVKASFEFAWVYFLVAAIPAFFINVGSFNLPVMMIVTWTIMSYLNGWIAGYFFTMVLK